MKIRNISLTVQHNNDAKLVINMDRIELVDNFEYSKVRVMAKIKKALLKDKKYYGELILKEFN